MVPSQFPTVLYPPSSLNEDKHFLGISVMCSIWEQNKCSFEVLHTMQLRGLKRVTKAGNSLSVETSDV